MRIDRSVLRSMPEDELERELLTYQKYSDSHERGFLQVIAEMTRREAAPGKAAERKERSRERSQRATSNYRDETYRQWLTAESGIQGGVLLNKAGIRAGIDERSLFSGSQSRVNKYASDELKEWFDAHPRMTRAEWDRRQRREVAAEREHARQGR